MKSELLSKLCNCLNGNATNYTVFLQSYRVAITSGKLSDEIVSSAMGADVLAVEFQEVTEDDVVAEIRDCLMFFGDSGAGPDAEMVTSLEFTNSLEELVAEVREQARAANKMERFWVKTGHPAYPVFWDFSFLFSSDDASVVFIGSASD